MIAIKAFIACALLQSCSASFPQLQNAVGEFTEGLKSVGNLTFEGVPALGFGGQNIFERQSCGAGQGQCGNVGECCSPNGGGECCGLYCNAQHPGGDCCAAGLCNAGTKCCGSGCMTAGRTCCGSRNCDPGYLCCGNQGGCYPAVGYKCCSNEGIYCAATDTCVYCPGTTRICCQGPHAAPPVPPTQANNPAPTQANPDPTTIKQTIQQTVQQTVQETVQNQVTITQTEEKTTTLAPQYITFSTTYIYSYIIWTQIIIVQPTIQSTTTTVTTIITVSATDRAAAAVTFGALAASISRSASSSAQAASPSPISSTSTARQTQLPTVSAGGGSSDGSVMRCHWALAAVGSLTAAVTLLF